MDAQHRNCRFKRFASYIVKIDIDPIRCLQIQLFEYRADFVIEGNIKSTFFS